MWNLFICWIALEHSGCHFPVVKYVGIIFSFWGKETLKFYQPLPNTPLVLLKLHTGFWNWFSCDFWYILELRNYVKLTEKACKESNHPKYFKSPKIYLLSYKQGEDKHEKSIAWEEYPIRRVSHEKSIQWEEYPMRRVSHEKSIPWEEYPMRTDTSSSFDPYESFAVMKVHVCRYIGIHH